MNAQEMLIKLKQYDTCPGLHEWIRGTLLNLFLGTNGKRTVAVLPRIIEVMWSRRNFIMEMRSLGYYVEFKTKQFEPEMCYISLPDEEN